MSRAAFALDSSQSYVKSMVECSTLLSGANADSLTHVAGRCVNYWPLAQLEDNNWPCLFTGGQQRCVDNYSMGIPRVEASFGTELAVCVWRFGLPPWSGHSANAAANRDLGHRRSCTRSRSLWSPTQTGPVRLARQDDRRDNCCPQKTLISEGDAGDAPCGAFGTEANSQQRVVTRETLACTSTRPPSAAWVERVRSVMCVAGSAV